MRLLALLLSILALMLMTAAQMARATQPTHPQNQALLSLVFPGIDSKGDARKSVVVRSLAGDYEPTELAGEMSARILNSLPISNGAHTDRLLVIDVTHQDNSSTGWGGQTLLALFRLAPGPRLLDVADVRADRETYFWKILRAARHDAVIIEATHLNAGEEFIFLNLIELVRDRFVESKVKLLLLHSTMSGSSSIAESATLKQPQKARPNTAIFTAKVLAKLNDPDSGVVKKQAAKNFTAELNLVHGRWQCARCNSMQKSITALENRFAYPRE